jgi:uncharacterized protein YecE (DUF72 family)
MPAAKFDEANFAAFLELLPHKIDGRTIRHAFEARHESFADPAYAALLRRHNVAAALIDAEGQKTAHEPTADFVYARLKSAAEDVPTGYPPDALEAWLKRFRHWTGDDGGSALRDGFVYFINGAKLRAPAAAMAFLEKLSR